MTDLIATLVVTLVAIVLVLAGTIAAVRKGAKAEREAERKRRDSQGYASQICWFCEVNEAWRSREFEVSLFQLLSRERQGKRLVTKFRTKGVRIPRCAACAQLHSRENWIIFGGSAIALGLAVTTGFLWNWVVGVAVFVVRIAIVFSLSLWVDKGKKHKLSNQAFSHPEVERLIDEDGWSLSMPG